MLRRDRQLRIQIYQFIDGGLFALGLWLGWLIRYHWHGLPIAGLTEPDYISSFYPDYFWLFLVVIPMTPPVLEWQGYYERPVFSPRRTVIWQLAKACTISAIGLVLIQFMVRREGARGVFVLFGFCSFGLLLAKEEMLRWMYRSKLGQAQFKRRLILLGTDEDIKALRAFIGPAAQELDIVGQFDLNNAAMEEFVSFLHERSVNTVIISAGNTVFGQIEAAIRACELEGVETWLLADFFKPQISHTSMDDFFGRPVLVFHCGPEMPWARLVKQMMDMVGGLVLLPACLLIIAVTGIIIKLTSRGPIFFQQERAGLNGQPFVMYKLRTMVSNAEQLKQELAALNEMSGPVFKVTNDPRVTPLGRFLRKTSLDEIPQIFNVLRGEMSLVGPRPLPVDEVKRFDDVGHRRRLSVKPGLTCLWQVSGRNNVKDFSEWVRLDLKYIDTWSLWLDLKILWRTVWVVLLGTGAR